MANSNPVESLKKELSYSQKAAGVIVSLARKKPPSSTSTWRARTWRP